MKKNVETQNMIFLSDILFTCWETYWEVLCFLTLGQVFRHMECKIVLVRYFCFLFFFSHYKLFEKSAWNKREYNDGSKGDWQRMKIKKRYEQGRKRKESVRKFEISFLRPKWNFSETPPEFFRTLPWFLAVLWISGRTSKCFCGTWEGFRVLNFTSLVTQVWKSRNRKGTWGMESLKE